MHMRDDTQRRQDGDGCRDVKKDFHGLTSLFGVDS
jgi:hypothetical protein